MNKKKLNKVILLLLIFCSYCSNPVEPPSLESMLFSTYKEAFINWSNNSIGNPIYGAVTTENTYLILKADGSYKMNLEIYVAHEDTIFIVYQEGSYKTIRATYVESSNLFEISHWEGTLMFTPNNQSIWEVIFSINEYDQRLEFYNITRGLFELPDSCGFIWVYNWRK
jgi:hypothetical protein